MKRKGFLKFFVKLLITCFITLCLLEVAYRYQWIDFYKAELEYFNDQEVIENDNIVHVFGDSFTAQKPGYVKILRDENPHLHFINHAVPGTNIQEDYYIAKKRLKSKDAAAVIIQIYPANDLSDFHKPVNWRNISLLRNLYWTFSEYFQVLKYINYKIGQFKFHSIDAEKTEGNQPLIDKNQYSPRTRLYLSADSAILNHSLHQTNSRISSAIKYQVQYLNLMVNRFSADVPIYLAVIPHCSQVGENYYRQFEFMNAEMIPIDSFQVNNYLFIQSLQGAMRRHENVQIVNCLETFKLKERENRLYYNNDIHLNQYGNEVLGNYLNDEIFNAN